MNNKSTNKRRTNPTREGKLGKAKIKKNKNHHTERKMLEGPSVARQ